MRLARRALPLAAAILAVVVLQGTALASTPKPVSIQNLAFSPTLLKVKVGNSVQWTNNDPFGHTSSSNGFSDGQGTVGVDLWHSGTIAPGSTFTFQFAVAGGFPYHCSIHASMKAEIDVKMKAKPTSGVVGDTIKIIWATVDPGTDFKFNVQMTDPNGKTFHDWMTNVPHNVLSGKFKPTQVGTYKFHSDLVRISTGVASGFSPALTVKIS